MRRAKIVCTLGPATDTQERMEELIRAGLDVARFNMSHGSHEEHARRLVEARAASKAVGKTIGLLADLQGPKIRLGRFAEGPVELVEGQTFTITIEDILGNAERCGTTFKGLPGDVRPGDTILIDDGRVQLEAVSVTDTDVVTKVVVPGPVSNNKGINLPGVAVNVPALSEKDEDDLRFALRNNFDLIALSFVRTGADVNRVHEIMAEEGLTLPVVAKIEKPQAVENLDDIIAAFDAFMVARGDLGVELPLEFVPMVQKDIISKARTKAKPVIVATQMLDSMIGSPTPTRAETSDVANAVLDGADAVMLSGETSIGAYPVRTVATMARIIAQTEAMGMDRIQKIDWKLDSVPGAVTMSALNIAHIVGATHIVSGTQSGDTARRLARYRGRIPLVAFTPDVKTAHVLTLLWGTQVFGLLEYHTTEEMLYLVDKKLIEQGVCQPGDRVVVVFGSPIGVRGHTNSLNVHVVQDVTSTPAHQSQ